MLIDAEVRWNRLKYQLELMLTGVLHKPCLFVGVIIIYGHKQVFTEFISTLRNYSSSFSGIQSSALSSAMRGRKTWLNRSNRVASHSYYRDQSFSSDGSVSCLDKLTQLRSLVGNSCHSRVSPNSL